MSLLGCDGFSTKVTRWFALARVTKNLFNVAQSQLLHPLGIEYAACLPPIMRCEGVRSDWTRVGYFDMPGLKRNPPPDFSFFSPIYSSRNSISRLETYTLSPSASMVSTSPVDAAILVFLAILSICSETLLSLPYCLHLHIVLAIFAFVSGSVRIFVECHVLQGAQIRDSSFHLSPRSSSIHIPSLPISTALSILFRWSRLRWLFVNAARRLVRRSSGFVPVCGVCLLTLGAL